MNGHPTPPSSRTRTRLGAALLAAASLTLTSLGSTAVAAPSAGERTSATTQAVIIQTSAADAQARGRIAAGVERLGGEVGLDLAIVNGFAAEVPTSALAHVERLPGVRVVTPDEAVRVFATNDSSSSTPVSVVNKTIHADDLHAKGVTGRGVAVAVIDTGVSPVADLAGRILPVTDPNGSGAKVACANFSGETGCEDSYGHGTFVAGLIAGNGAASGGAYKGAAPEANIVSVKIAGRDGAADVSKVLAAIQWVTTFQHEYNIKVMNLSLGTDSQASYRHDPLNYAVERAWRSGVTVVVSASNRGPGPGTISKPADDPLVITTGAVDDRSTAGSSDDRLPAFSGRGPTVDGLSKPDLTAPGARVISLRAPGSHIEEAAPGGGLAGTPYRRGSGTSMSAGVVSGAVALLHQAQPSWSPDRVKFALRSTAQKVASDDVLAVGAGIIDVERALGAGPGLANQNVTVLSDGTGSLDKARGSVYVTGRDCLAGEETVDPNCAVVNGNETARGTDLRDSSWYADQYQSSWTGNSWYSSQWVESAGSSWYGNSWYGSSWYGNSWYGSSWYGSTDDTFYGTSLQGSSWYGAWS